jgi:hypothetical protein
MSHGISDSVSQDDKEDGRGMLTSLEDDSVKAAGGFSKTVAKVGSAKKTAKKRKERDEDKANYA